MSDVKLSMTKGPEEGKVYPLDKDVMVLGRQATCDIVIPVTSVSREHAKITSSNGDFFLHDNESRNGTFLNNNRVDAKLSEAPLRNGDRIRICDVEFTVSGLPEQEVPAVAQPLAEDLDAEPGEEDSPSIEAAVSNNNQVLEAQPAEKLRGLLEISANLSKTLELEPLLPKVADTLFQVFRQADRCFIILTDDSNPARLIPKVLKTRRPQDETNARFSRTIVKKCLESGEAFTADDASRSDAVGMSQSVVDFRIRSVMCVPLIGLSGKPFGVVQLDTQDRSKKFNREDLSLLWCVANQAAIAMENAKMHQRAIQDANAKASRDADMKLAKQVQSSFLPESEPDIKGYKFKAYYKSAQEVGGDYYGYTELPGGRLAIAIGDVAGKGVPAALIMGKVSSETRFWLLTEPDVGQAVSKINTVLYPTLEKLCKFVTFETVVIDPAANKLVVVNAGHMLPLLVPADGGDIRDVVSDEITGLPLGVTDEVPFDSKEFEINPGDKLLLYSDGVSEAMSVKGEQFGMEAIKQVLADNLKADPAVVVEKLVEALDRHAAGREYPHDDITIVCIGRCG
jgi:serine phosphatase RsbU (regulator of sigma subunit)/pSer/pThr/pTyr-binding forkhead associated (FHA) protein